MATRAKTCSGALAQWWRRSRRISAPPRSKCLFYWIGSPKLGVQRPNYNSGTRPRARGHALVGADGGGESDDRPAHGLARSKFPFYSDRIAQIGRSLSRGQIGADREKVKTDQCAASLEKHHPALECSTRIRPPAPRMGLVCRDRPN